MDQGAVRAVRGRFLKLAPVAFEQRDWLYEALQRPAVYEALSGARPPERAFFDANLLEIYRQGREKSHEAVRYHVLTRLSDGLPVGFFLDFGWDYPSDTTREIDLVFPNPSDRGLATYLDATVIVSQYMFGNHLAKRLRWRVVVKAGLQDRRGLRHGGRLLSRSQEVHPVSGALLERCIYEYARSDWLAILEAVGVPPDTDYAEVRDSVWSYYRAKALR